MRVLSSHRVASKSSSASILWVARRATITAAASWSKPDISDAKLPPSAHLQDGKPTCRSATDRDKTSESCLSGMVPWSVFVMG